MKTRSLIASTGFALFSMFFGSGNLVFPITVGKESNGEWLFSVLGILSTGVIVPFLGVLGIFLYKGSFERFFAVLGKKGIFLFSFFALSIMGPFGVLARCLTVMHGALSLLLPDISLSGASFFFCVTIYFLSMNRNAIVTTLGSILTPLLLLSIILLAFFGLAQASMPTLPAVDNWESFKGGFLQGYYTMDLLAAFFFAAFVIEHLQKKTTEAYRIFSFSAFLGAGLLSLVYIVLVLLGAIYAPYLQDVPPQEMLAKIALLSLGEYAAPCVCLVILFACLTTAITLTSLFSDFLSSQVLKMKNHYSLAITLMIAFFVSTLDFVVIGKFLGPILEAIYPALIFFTFGNIIWFLVKKRQSTITSL